MSTNQTSSIQSEIAFEDIYRWYTMGGQKNRCRHFARKEQQ